MKAKTSQMKKKKSIYTSSDNTDLHFLYLNINLEHICFQYFTLAVLVIIDFALFITFD